MPTSTDSVEFLRLSTIRSNNLSFLSFGYIVRTLITGAIGSIIMEHTNWHYVFYFIGSSTLFIAYIVSFYSKRQRRKTYFSFQNGRTGTRKDAEERKALPLMKIITKRPFWWVKISRVMLQSVAGILKGWLIKLETANFSHPFYGTPLCSLYHIHYIWIAVNSATTTKIMFNLIIKWIFILTNLIWFLSLYCKSVIIKI